MISVQATDGVYRLACVPTSKRTPRASKEAAGPLCFGEIVPTGPGRIRTLDILRRQCFLPATRYIKERV